MADKLMRTVVVMTFFLILALFSGCGTNVTGLTEADNGKNIILKTGDILTISLESNVTTGYSWQVMELDQAVLVQEGESEYKQSPGSEGLVGGGGTETFRFKAVGPGRTALGLGYMQPWESEPPVETFTIQIEIG